jgi:hypothetical protein
MSNYYVVRLTIQFKVMYMDAQSAAKWVDAGWEVRKYDSNDEAQLAMAEWEEDSRKAKLFVVKRQA